MNHRVIAALNQLTNKQKEAIYLRFNESLEYKEIADILKITVESARKQIAIKGSRRNKQRFKKAGNFVKGQGSMKIKIYSNASPPLFLPEYTYLLQF